MEGKKKVIGLGILLSVLFLISAAYAWLSVSVTSNTKQVIHAGKLDLVLDDEESSGIHMENVVPTSDIKGREQEGYQFKLINRGTISSRYALYLDDLSLEAGEERMKDSVVKYSLERDGVELSSGLLPEMGSNPNRILDTGIINGKTTYSYVLKVWMDEEATIENQGTIFYTKIRAEAEQTNIPIKKSEMELTPESQEKVPIKDGEDPRDYTYTSSDWNVVKVDEEGNIEVIGPGYAVITKTDQYGEKEEITVHVTVPVTAEFRTNDKINSIGSVENNTCNLTENNQMTCQVKVPSVEVKEGYEFVGWSTEESSHEGKKETIEVSPDKKILYPIIKTPGKTLTATFVKQGSGVESIGSESESCKIADTYNNDTLETSCQITLPNMTVKEGYEAIGWNTNQSATEGITPDIININQDTKFYTIYKKKKVNLKATFVLNGAKSLNGLDADQLENGKLTLTCTVPESYSGQTETNSCEVIAPTIEASDVTPNIIGFNENKDAIISSVKSGDTVTISTNKTYYTLTSSGETAKTLKATFYKNKAEKIDGQNVESIERICNVEITYNGHPPKEGCSILVPSIEAPRNTPKILGYSTGEDLHEENTEYLIPEKEVLIKENVSYYAQTTNDNEIAYTVTYQKGSNVISIERETDACTVPPSYNGEPRGDSCTVTAPDYTVADGYKKVEYNESKDAKDGTTNITLKKDTTYYANAAKTIKTIEYYHNGEMIGTSNTDGDITLKDFQELNISKTGYHFKGWDTKEEATDVIYSDGATIDDLTEGETRKIYAVWVDDIAPVCTFSDLQDSYTVGDKFNVTITCTDEGSGLIDPGETAKTMVNSNGFNITENNVTLRKSDYYIIHFSSCNLQNGVLTCEYEAEANATGGFFGDKNWTHLGEKEGFFLKGYKIFDQAGNYNEYTRSDVADIKGVTFTATMTQEGVEGTETLGTTTESCTSEFDDRSCMINLGTDVTVKDGYRWAGWNTDKTATQGAYTFTLTEDITFYPIAGPIFVDAYLYDQTKAEGETGRCITGEESTCEKTTCYKDGGTCDAGTIFKYAVKSTYNNESTHDQHRVDSLNDHIYYFYVLHDDGAKLTLQQRESITRNAWSWSQLDISEGPISALETLKGLTDDWNYVEEQSVAYGVTEYFGNFYTGCVNGNPVNCSTNLYTWETPKTAKARLVTAQEIGRVGCNIGDGCPIWAYNYLNGCVDRGCTENGGPESAYWLSNALNATNAFRIYANGHVVYGPKYEMMVGLRPVIELNKSRFNK